MAATDIISVAEARQEIGGLSASLDDQLLAAYVTAVSQHIDRLVGPVVNRTITGEIHATNGEREIFLRQSPVSSITSCTEYTMGGTAQTITVDTLTTKNGYGCWLNTTDQHTARLQRRNNGMPTYWPIAGSMTVTYVAGRYATTDVVDELYKHAARLAVATNWSIQQGSGSATWGNAEGPGMSPLPIVMPRAVEAMLAHERRVPGIA
jgi:hypothetical protein